MLCRQWSLHDGIDAPGLCSFQMIPETGNSTKSCSICLTPQEAERVARLRAFDVDSGALLWEKIKFRTIGKSPSGATYGYRWRNVTLGKEYEYIQTWFVPVLSYAAPFNSTTELQRKNTSTADRSGQTWSGDCIRVDISGDETVVMQDAVRQFVEGGSPSEIPVGSYGTFSTYSAAEPQQYNCSDDHLYMGYRYQGGFNQFMVEMTDKDKRVKKHTLRFLPGLVFPMTSNTPKWAVKCGTTVARFGLYATASEVETELLTLDGVVSVAAVGGPLCQDKMDVEIEFDTVDRQLSHLCVEWASGDLPSASTVGANVNVPIWSLATHTYFAPLSLKTLRISSFMFPSFASMTSGIIAVGNWGPSSNPNPLVGAPKTALSLLRWGPEVSSTPNWRTISEKVWQALPFDGMIQTQEWLETGSESFAGFGVSAIAEGKIAVTASSRRHPVLDGTIPWQTHVIIDEGTGTGISVGWSGFLAGTTIRFCGSNNQYRTGVRKRYSPSGSSAVYAEPLYIESFGGDPDAADLRETDVSLAYGVGTKQVVIENSWISQTFSQTFAATNQFNSSQGGSGHSYSAPWMSGSTGTIAANSAYPFGSYRRDYFFLMSSFTRFSASTEWQLLHGSVSAGTFTPFKQSSWFPLFVSLDTVKAELAAWYGSISGGGNPIVFVNPWGEDPAREAASPPLPTWQRINEIWVYRNATSTPNPFSPLVPVSINAMSLKLRNKRRIRTHPLAGLNPETGEIVWQRDIGMHPTLNQPAGGSPVAFYSNTIVVQTECKAGVDTPIFPRGS